MRLDMDRWEIDRGDIEIDDSFNRSGNFGTVNKVQTERNSREEVA